MEWRPQRLAKKAAAGADFVKTSTGFGRGGATAEDVALMATGVADAGTTGAFNTGYPSICVGFAHDAGSDRLNGSLKTFEVPFRSEPDHTTTIRTAIKLEQQRAYEPIKDCLSITMSP